MERPILNLTQIDLSAEDVPAMVAFYDGFFGADLQPFEAFGAKLWRGNLGGIPLLLCPNSIAGVEATRNRHQLNYRTPDLAAAIEAARLAGGQVRDETDTSATILDPDGNTIVVLQAT